MPHAVFGHQLHAFLDGMLQPDGNHFGGNNLAHAGFPGGFSLKNDFARVIALRKNPRQFPARYDKHRADVFVRHELDGFKDGGFRRDRPNLRSLVVQQRAHCAAGFHRLDAYIRFFQA